MKKFFVVLLSLFTFLYTFSAVGQSTTFPNKFVSPKINIRDMYDFNTPKTKIGEDRFPPTITILRKDTNILYILNGKVVKGKKSQKLLDQLKPNDIESIQVISPTDAVKIYGNKAAKGAIIIKTKPTK